MNIFLSSSDFIIILPEIILAVFGALILILEPFFPRERKNSLFFLALIGILLSLAATLSLWNGFGSAFSQMIVWDNFSLFLQIIFLISSFLIVLISASYLKNEGIQRGEYYALILFSTLGMMLMASSFSLIVIFLGLEIMSLNLYVLAGFKREEVKGIESSMKYFLMGAFATGFLLYGIALIYGATGSFNLQNIFLSIYILEGTNLTLLYVGLGLLLIGFGFKIASVPFHMWVPDVYEGAPTPVTAFISAGPKAAGFAVLLRVFLFTFGGLQGDWWMVLWVLSALTMTVGNILAISQKNIKRMLAYSSIAHAGYVLVAIVSGGNQGIYSALFYLFAYTFMNIGAFAIVTLIGSKNERFVNLDDYAGLASKHPWLSFAMLLFMFSLAGIPPTAGFMAKFYVFSSAVNSGFIWLVLIGVLNSLISVYFYLRVVVLMYMHKSEVAAELKVPVGINLALLICSFFVIFIGIFPQIWLNLVSQSLNYLF
jgi:NADH-quinone oxidoreductase subunit N